MGTVTYRRRRPLTIKGAAIILTVLTAFCCLGRQLVTTADRIADTAAVTVTPRTPYPPGMEGVFILHLRARGIGDDDAVARGRAACAALAAGGDHAAAIAAAATAVPGREISRPEAVIVTDAAITLLCQEDGSAR